MRLIYPDNNFTSSLWLLKLISQSKGDTRTENMRELKCSELCDVKDEFA